MIVVLTIVIYLIESYLLQYLILSGIRWYVSYDEMDRETYIMLWWVSPITIPFTLGILLSILLVDGVIRLLMKISDMFDFLVKVKNKVDNRLFPK